MPLCLEFQTRKGSFSMMEHIVKLNTIRDNLIVIMVSVSKAYKIL